MCYSWKNLNVAEDNERIFFLINTTGLMTPNTLTFAKISLWEIVSDLSDEISNILSSLAQLRFIKILW